MITKFRSPEVWSLAGVLAPNLLRSQPKTQAVYYTLSCNFQKWASAYFSCRAIDIRALQKGPLRYSAILD